MRLALALLAAALLAGCDCNNGNHDGGVDAGHCSDAGVPSGGWCSLPHTMVNVAGDPHKEPNGDSHLKWLSVPLGWCAHSFATVGNARAMRFAPGGELFVASPVTGTTGGGLNGNAGIVFLADDDGDGTADQVVPWRTADFNSTQGMLFADGHLYFQDHTKVKRDTYEACQRAPKGDPEQLADIQVYVDQLHWPKTLDQAEDGTIYVTNGGSQSETCDPSMPFHGGILALDSTAPNGVRQVAKGLRNPMYVRCHHDGHNRCFASELAKDYSASEGGREKLLLVADQQDWGYPCCASQNLPYTDVCLACSSSTDTLANSTSTCKANNQCSPKCSSVSADSNSFIIGNTPFGLDFTDDQFPNPFKHQVIVALHGEFASWRDAKVVSIALDPATGLTMPSSTVNGNPTGALQDFATGWDDGQLDHGRPSDVAVSPDGRVFISNDVNGEIFWMAPVK
ncbi:MAG: hypothetical protein QM723_24135 [Myxococcaceae bacterium]